MAEDIDALLREADALSRPAPVQPPTPEELDGLLRDAKIIGWMQPEGAVKSVLREGIQQLPRAVGNLLGGAGGTALAGLTGPAAPVTAIPFTVAGALAGGEAADRAKDAVKRVVLGEEGLRREELQREMNARARPFATTMAGFAAQTPAMFSGGKAASSVLKLLPTSRVGQAANMATSFGIMGATQERDIRNMPEAFAKGTVTSMPLAFVPHFKSLLGSVGVRGVTDPALLNMAGAVWDKVVNGKPIDLDEFSKQSVAQIPEFALMNLVTGILGRQPILPRRPPPPAVDPATHQARTEEAVNHITSKYPAGSVPPEVQERIVGAWQTGGSVEGLAELGRWEATKPPPPASASVPDTSKIAKGQPDPADDANKAILDEAINQSGKANQPPAPPPATPTPDFNPAEGTGYDKAPLALVQEHAGYGVKGAQVELALRQAAGQTPPISAPVPAQAPAAQVSSLPGGGAGAPIPAQVSVPQPVAKPPKAARKGKRVLVPPPAPLEAATAVKTAPVSAATATVPPEGVSTATTEAKPPWGAQSKPVDQMTPEKSYAAAGSEELLNLPVGPERAAKPIIGKPVDTSPLLPGSGLDARDMKNGLFVQPPAKPKAAEEAGAAMPEPEEVRDEKSKDERVNLLRDEIMQAMTVKELDAIIARDDANDILKGANAGDAQWLREAMDERQKEFAAKKPAKPLVPPPVKAKPVAEDKPAIETDLARVQEIRNSIAEGEMILSSGKTIAGRKMTASELDAVRKSVENAKRKIGEQPAEPAAVKPLPDALNAGEKVKPPKGATFIKVTDMDGKSIELPLSEMDTLKGAGPYKSAVWGIKGKAGFVAMPRVPEPTGKKSVRLAMAGEGDTVAQSGTTVEIQKRVDQARSKIDELAQRIERDSGSHTLADAIGNGNYDGAWRERKIQQAINSEPRGSRYASIKNDEAYRSTEQGKALIRRGSARGVKSIIFIKGLPPDVASLEYDGHLLLNTESEKNIGTQLDHEAGHAAFRNESSPLRKLAGLVDINSEEAKAYQRAYENSTGRILDAYELKQEIAVEISSGRFSVNNINLLSTVKDIAQAIQYVESHYDNMVKAIEAKYKLPDLVPSKAPADVSSAPWKEAGFKDEQSFLEKYEKDANHDAKETPDEYARRIYCTGLKGKNNFSIKGGK